MGEKKQIRIAVNDKIACLVDKEQFLVCGNNDYEVVFDFDNDWEGIEAKTAVFVYGNTPVPKPFVGNVCEGIEIKNATLCAIGVFAGDIKTTTGATITCRQSIRDIGGVPKPPSKEVYDEIMALLDEVISKVEEDLVRIDEKKANKYTYGLSYELSADGTYYSLTGIGEATEKDIVVPSFYEGVPITGVKKNAFQNNKTINSVVLPEGLTHIGDYAFSYSGITKIELPSTLTYIGLSAFMSCTGLKTILIPKSVNNISMFAFTGCSNLKIYCEAKSKPSKWADTWNESNRPVLWGSALDIPSLNDKFSEISIPEGGVSKEELDKKIAEGVSGKVDKITEANKVYGTNTSKQQISIDWSYGATGNTIARRKANGNSAVPLKPSDDNDATSKNYVDEANKALTEKQTSIEERVSNLENLTLDYPEDSTVAYEKIVPANVGNPAFIDMVGGASEVVRSKNILNPRDILFDGGGEWSETYNSDGTITYTAYGPMTGNLYLRDLGLPIGKYYIYIEGGYDNDWHYYEDDEWLEIYLSAEFDEEVSDYVETTRTLKVMLWQDTSVTTETYEFTEAPEGTVFEPYVEPHFKHAKVERIESLGKNRLPSDVYDINSWVLDGGNTEWKRYYLDFLNDGWYCVSLKLKEEYSGGTYFYIQKSVDGGVTYSSDNASYNARGYANKGYLITGNGIEGAPAWFKVDKKAGVIYRFNAYGLTQSAFEKIYDIQIEKVELAQEPSPSYLPSTYAPATKYTPYLAEPIDSLIIPESVRSKDGYGREGSYIEYKDGAWSLTVTKDENLELLEKPIVTDVTADIIAANPDFATKGNAIKIERCGIIRFVNANEMAVPSTVGYVTRKE